MNDSFCGICRKWDPEHRICNVNGLPTDEYADGHGCTFFKNDMDEGDDD